MKWLIGVVLCSGCLASNSVLCGEQQICPAGDACDDTHHLCVLPEQLSACAGSADGTECTAKTVTGHCLDQVCLPSVCGDKVVEFAEMCDDGNSIDGVDGVPDGCSADCHSDFRCGNGVTDAYTHEQCDLGDNLDHDGCSSTCEVEVPAWELHALSPPPRSGATASYDSRRDRIVAFGGLTPAFELLDETLEWNGIDWVRVAVSSRPPARDTSAAAYDVAHDRTVMFGGFDGTYETADTWAWNGRDWTNLAIAGPIERYGQAMVYDAKRGVIVMFGGWQDQHGVMQDTWELADLTWTLKAPAHVPPVREFANATFDPVRGVLVMTGGDDGHGVYLNDTWTYDGVDWTNATPAGTSPRVSRAGIAFDVASKQILMFGGLTTGGTATQATWAWNGATWTNLGNSATATSRAAMVMAATRTQTVLFSGGAVGDTYVWSNASKTWTVPESPTSRFRFAAANDPAGRRVLIYGGQISAGGTATGDTWSLDPGGYALRAGAPPSKREAFAMAWDPLHAQLVVFGGAAGGLTSDVVNNETWVWTGSGWTQRFPPASPSARINAAMAWDGQRIVLHGGRDKLSGGNYFADSWAWDGTTWTPITSPGPGPRQSAAAAYDPVRDELVMFGGEYNIDDTNETWTEHGGVWTAKTGGYLPNKANSATFVWNPARRSLILANSNTSSMQVYEWNGATWSFVNTTDNPPVHAWAAGFTTLDGGGTAFYGGIIGGVISSERWELRWQARHNSDSCTAADEDGDGLVGCADPDCWPICTPLCPPSTSCPTGPTCGDGACDAPRESCAVCPADCGACP